MRSSTPVLRVAARQQLSGVGRVVVVGRQQGDGAGRLGEAVDLLEAAREDGQGLLQELGRDRRRAVDDQAQAREIGLADLRRLHQEQDHGGDQQHHLQPLALDQLQDFRRDELAHDMVGGAGEQAGHAPAGAADMEHRQAHEIGHAGRQQPGPGPQRKHPGEVGVGELGAFGQAGGAAGVELDGGVAGPDRPAADRRRTAGRATRRTTSRRRGGRRRPRSCATVFSPSRIFSITGKNSSPTNRISAWASFRMCSTSGGARRQLTETITALALAVPNSSSKKMSLLLSRWATRACGLMPSAISPLATRLAARSSSA